MLCLPATAQTSYKISSVFDNPFIGIWELDLSKSDFGSTSAPQRMTRTYEDRGDGTFMYLIDSVSADGSSGDSSAVYKYDGLEYPLISLNQDSPVTISYRKINERTVEYTVRINGNITQIGAKSISSNGNILSIGVQSTDAQGDPLPQVLIFNKRR